MSQNELTIQARDSKYDQSDKEGSILTASNDSEAGDNDLYGVISRNVVEQTGEYFTLTVTDDEDAVEATLTGDTKRFGKYETAGRQVYGLGINRSILEDLFGEETPESIYLRLSPSTEEAYQEALDELDTSAEDEAEALVVGGGEGDSEEAEAEQTDEEEEAEELVEISDDELDI